MGLEVYYPTDIRNALLAAEQATTAALGTCPGQPAQGDGDGEYRRGYLAALTTVALAFGLTTGGDDRAGLPRAGQHLATLGRGR